MNKGDLIDTIVKEAKISKASAEKALNTVIDSVGTTLKKGDKVAVVGFGTFSVSRRKARKGRNPQTGKEIKIPAKKVVKFSAGNKLKARVAK
ncbi:MAG: HU family DNA-binding protein [Syntrophorhabdaceae bacterium]|nr:HU family DNA-binding protein [Syntrophorhabdaceae bacterium]